MSISLEIVDRLVAEITQSERAHDYFFDKTSSVRWLLPLKERGFFKFPPDPVRDGNMISFPRWSESQYLARCAAEAPTLVRQIIEEAEPTDNPRVHEDYLKACQAMPADESIRIVSMAEDWLSRPQYPLLVVAEYVASLAVKIGEAGFHSEAVSLMAKVLDVVPGPPGPLPDDHPYYTPPDARPRFPLYDYERILAEDLPRLVKAVERPALTMVCDMLDSALRLERRPGSGPEDYSSIWRPTVEDNSQNLPNQLLGSLVAAERDSALALVRAGAMSLSDIATELQDRHWKIHLRILFYILSEMGERDPRASGTAIANHRYIRDQSLWHEYSLLVRRRFGDIAKHQQHAFLKNVATGPDVERIRKSYEGLGHSDAEAAADKEVRGWKWLRLGLVKNHLEPRWQRIYQELVQEFGADDSEDLHDRSRFWIGPTSPKTKQELAAMADDDLVTFLMDWRATRSPMSASREGLGRVLQEVAKEDPKRFTSQPNQFKLPEPTFVAAILMGIREAADAGLPFDWNGVIELGQWAVGQGGLRFPDRSTMFEDGDVDWSHCRLEVAHSLKPGFAKSATEMPIELAASVWSVVSALAGDQNPTIEDETRSSMDPMTYSLNCVRGQAIECVARYALWKARHHNLFAPTGGQSHAFESMPEVRSILEMHLDPLVERSLAVRSVYGQFFPYLVLLDSDWAARNASRIFAEAEGERPYWAAAWNAFVVTGRAYRNTFAVLRHQYQVAVHRLKADAEGDDGVHPESSGAGLSSHLLALYLHADIELDDPLLRQFLRESTPALRRYMMFEIGRMLRLLEGETRSGIVPRLQALWHQRVQAVDRGRFGAAPTELEPFGWWFSSGRLPEEWALSQLERLLEQRIVPDSEHLVLERLAVVAHAFPSRVVQATRRMLHLSNDPWKPLMWIKELREIIETAVASSEEGAPDLGRVLAAECVAKGLNDLRQYAATR